MRIDKFIARKLVFPSLITLGFEKILLNGTRNNLLNLYYHGVVNKDSNYLFPRHIAKVQFEDHLKYFTKNFNIVSINEAFEIYRNNIPLDRKTITITFDDGYENNLTVVLPLLEKYKIKSSFFISGKIIEDFNYFLWADVLSLCRFLEKGNVVLINKIPFLKYDKYDLYNNELKLNAGPYLKTLEKEIREKVIEELIDHYKINKNIPLPREIWKLLDEKQVKTLSESPFVSIGSHGYTHSNLDSLTRQDVEIELKKSKLLIEDCIKRQIDTIAFPDGAYNEDIKKIAHDCGYKNLVAVNYRCPEDYSDLSILPRWGLSSTTNKYSNIFFISKAFLKQGLRIP